VVPRSIFSRPPQADALGTRDNPVQLDNENGGDASSSYITPDTKGATSHSIYLSRLVDNSTRVTTVATIESFESTSLENPTQALLNAQDGTISKVVILKVNPESLRMINERNVSIGSNTLKRNRLVKRGTAHKKTKLSNCSRRVLTGKALHNALAHLLEEKISSLPEAHKRLAKEHDVTLESIRELALTTCFMRCKVGYGHCPHA
jgi:hypothetical protein